jgi:hypothetical protein
MTTKPLPIWPPLPPIDDKFRERLANGARLPQRGLRTDSGAAHHHEHRSRGLASGRRQLSR